MAAKKSISITLDPEVLEDLRRLVHEGEATSISAVINETMRICVERRWRAEQARKYVEEALLGGQSLTEEEMVEARATRAASTSRIAARREPRCE